MRAESGVFSSVRSVERLDRRLRVARDGKFAREVARLGAQPPRIVAEKGLEQPQQRAPALHRLAEVMDRGGVGLRLVVQYRARFGQDVASDGAESLADRNIRTHGGFLGHAEFYDGGVSQSTGWPCTARAARLPQRKCDPQRAQQKARQTGLGG